MESRDGKENNKKTVEQIYQKKTQLEHILLRPDTYIGSTESITQPLWIYDDNTDKIINQKITYVPGLYKIFDEIIVNASDNKQRDPTMDTLKVTINEETNEISVFNNGAGIPVVMHKEHHVYIPELIFGHLLTGSNFDDKKKKTTGGRNGYGAKLANIFSKKFTIETVDTNNHKKYVQHFKNNMTVKQEPVITTIPNNSKIKDYTRVTFIPDFDRFSPEDTDSQFSDNNKKGLTKDIISLFKKRVYDIAGISDKSLNVYFNNKKINVKSFPKYVELYQKSSIKKNLDEDKENSNPADDDNNDEGTAIMFDKPSDRWQVGAGISSEGFQQISFVNGICTTKGGQHVNYITDQIVSKLINTIKRKNNGDAVKSVYLKNHLAVYVTCLIDNPAFDSQTKETLTTRASSFGSIYSLSDKFLKQLEKSGLVERILSYAKFKQTAELRRKNNTSATSKKLIGITKLDDANFAGHIKKAQDCTLILTEGDSAKSTAIQGIAAINGRDYYGVFPLKGKLLNVREASHSQILKNEEIQNIVKIMGLKFGHKYNNTNTKLRYGHLMIMADQDHDGSHIKGLVINFIHHFWPELLMVKNFLQEFITPIVKCTYKNSIKTFFTLPEFERWDEQNNADKKWKIKYYKGLGTSGDKEAEEYFMDLKTHVISFSCNKRHSEDSNEKDNNMDAIEMAFSRKRCEDRKEWLRNYVPGTFVDYKVDRMLYSEFVNKELILFSRADNLRSISCLMDGLKPSQRKVLFSCFKRNLKTEIKVAQLAGYVSEHSAYHHGEMSLTGTIINMAQNYTGSNNINLLSPIGQFGTRYLGGKDAASARYINTKLEKITRKIFNLLDDKVLTYLNDDGLSIEPDFYVPIIPLVLVNGCEGIGTGWSCNIPNFNPIDIIKNLRRLINNEELEPMVPWYKGFNGSIIPKDANYGSFIVHGKYNVVDTSTVIITELPIKMWTQSYKQYLETLVESNVIVDFKENHTPSTVYFTVSFAPNSLNNLLKKTNNNYSSDHHENEDTVSHPDFLKKMRLETTISTSNMHLFDEKGIIQKYNTTSDIIKDFYKIRYNYYTLRKNYLIQALEKEIRYLYNKKRFIYEVIENKIVINNSKRKVLLQELKRNKFDSIYHDSKRDHDNDHSTNEADPADVIESDNDDDEEKNLIRGYDYLLSMKIWNLTKEKAEKLKNELANKKNELETVKNTTIEEMWLKDLDALEIGLQEFYKDTDDLTALNKKNEKQFRPFSSKNKSKKNANRSKKKDFALELTDTVDSNIESNDSDFEVKECNKKKKSKNVSKNDFNQKNCNNQKQTKMTAFIDKTKENDKDDETDEINNSLKDKEVIEIDSDGEVHALATRIKMRMQVTPVKEGHGKTHDDKSESSDLNTIESSENERGRPLPAIKRRVVPLKRRKENTPGKLNDGSNKSIIHGDIIPSPSILPPNKKKQKKKIIVSDTDDSNDENKKISNNNKKKDSIRQRPSRSTSTTRKVIYNVDLSESDNESAFNNNESEISDFEINENEIEDENQDEDEDDSDYEG